jgi:diadenosine tetraphosphatase ApaH/serine/threonine PP2A family protein phosphatase
LPATYRYGIHSPKEFKGLELLTLTRYLNPEGQFVSLGHETPQDLFWAESYDGRYGRIVFGHQPFPDDPAPRRFPHAIGIDTGCVQGGRLSALVFKEDGMIAYL